MTGAKLDDIVTLACTELVGAIMSQPGLRGSKISYRDIDIASASLYWPDNDGHSSLQETQSDSQYDDLMKFAMEPLRLGDEHYSLSVKTFASSDWKSTGSGQSGQQGPSTTDVNDLPEGLREFIYQVEFLYGTPHPEGRISEHELVASIGSSEHLTIIFPHIIRFTVNRIRTVSRSSSVGELLELLQSVVVNPHYTVKNHEDFQIILNCLLGLIVDPNLMDNESEQERQKVRTLSAEILSHFLKSKLGIHHSTRHAKQLVDELLIPFIQQAVKSPPAMWSSVAGAVSAVSLLVGNFMNMDLKNYNPALVKAVASAMSAKDITIDPACESMLKSAFRT
jgi:hypothetical protein